MMPIQRAYKLPQTMEVVNTLIALENLIHCIIERNNDYIIIYSESKHELTIDIYIKPLEKIYTYWIIKRIYF